MADRVNILIVSDIHYASLEEKARGSYEANAVSNPIIRLLLTAYRRYIWLRDPLAHNHLLDRALQYSGPVDWCVANGDYSCDSAFIGICDDPSLASAQECLGKLRERFGARFLATPGDHEFGKISLAGGKGGLRLASWRRLESALHIEPFWTQEVGNYLLMGITSSLVALPTYEPETLPEERQEWFKLRETHLEHIRSAFRALKSSQRVLLFCHDPTALPYLAGDAVIGAHTSQIERTVIGHLHTGLVFRLSQRLAGIPTIQFLGNAVRRMSSALNRARHWRTFKPLLCPSLSGSELLKDGGFYTVALDLTASAPAHFEFHPLPRAV